MDERDGDQGVEEQRQPRRLVYAEAPVMLYWEVTRACDLACHHCRAAALPQRDPGELTPSEAKRLLDKMRRFGSPLPHLVVTGGDPLKRPDVFSLLEYGAHLGFRMSMAPSGTQGLTRAVAHRLKATGVESISLSLDGSTADRHDRFRGVPGCFDWTLTAARLARWEGLAVQINTLVTAETEADLAAIYRLVSGLSPRRWSLFFLVQVGRGQLLSEITPERCEALLHWLYERSKAAPFAVATTEAPHYRRVALTRMRLEGVPLARMRQTPVGRGFGIRDGNGIMFVSHTGEVYPAGFLPLRAGNVRNADIVELYRTAEVFVTLRQTSRLKGRCGRCEFKEICGGSRARAYAWSGDPLETDPLCAYQPVT
jgi:radical SAM protein